MRKSCLPVGLCLVLAVGGVFMYTQYAYLSASGVPERNVSIARPTQISTLVPTLSSGKENNTCNDLLVLVDKSHALPASYTPSDLVYLKDYAIPVNNFSLIGRRVMIDELQKLFTDGASAGFNLVAASVYRSYAAQASIYNTYVQDYGAENANTFSAKPGQSQHQLGTAIDFTTAQMGYGLSQAFANTGAGRWLLANAYRYGFYISYPQGQESITKYEYEPWHFRYLGVQNVQNLIQSGLIMQTYLEKMAVIPHC